ncbi:MAG: phenylalanine--tRNA ligase subunit beta [Verrucomicrobiota bacterium]
MKYSLNWLQDHLDLTGLSLEELDRLLTFAGIEVEGLETIGLESEQVVVAQIKAAEPHPDADRLKVCRVDAGTGQDLQIVCGATNYQLGDKVPLALIGAVLPGDFKIKESKLRGVSSHGMLCSGKELGVGDDHAGLLLLDPALPLGKPFQEIVPPDTILELEITPNRPDLLSHLGLARELAALTGRELKSPPALSAIPAQTSSESELTLHDPAGCPFYSARIIRGVQVKESPAWLQDKLTAIGLRPINNLVDITNFVLMEMGQPLHVFDLAKLAGPLQVRGATAGEPFQALDGETYALSEADLVIADAQKPVALAGVMGGLESGVSATTTDLLLEAAYFTPSRVRRTSHRHHLHSDSSYRFERGVDPQQILGASELATKWILELAGGQAQEPLACQGQLPAAPPAVPFHPERAHHYLGGHLPEGSGREILRKLGLSETEPNLWQPPTWRLDLPRHIDLVEEIARVAGLDDVPTTTTSAPAESSPADLARDYANRLRSTLAARGYQEARTIKLTSPAANAGAPWPSLSPVSIKNPLSEDYSQLRGSLVPGLLEVLERNLRFGAESLAFFEMGTTFSQGAETTAEQSTLGLLLAGPRTGRSWVDPKPEDSQVFDLKGLLESLLPAAAFKWVPLDLPQAALAVEIRVGKNKLGRLGLLPPALARDLGYQGEISFAEVDLSKWTTLALRPNHSYQEPPKFPVISRDVAMEVPFELPNRDLAGFFKGLHEPLLVAAEPFDVFTDPSGEKLAPDRKSVAYSLTYRDASKTLTSEEVDAAHARVLEKLKSKLPVEIR